jgi:L-alanine-DL-glutamate epimerase-like enolase superfamily enzyme
MYAKDQGQERDIEVTRAVRERFPDCRILVDANNGCTEIEFENYVTAVADCELYCIEEPFDESLEDYSAFRFEHGDLVVPDAPGFGIKLIL